MPLYVCSRFMEYTLLKVNLKINYILGMIMIYQKRIISAINISLWYKILIVERLCMNGEMILMGTMYFLLNLVLNLKWP